VLTAKAQATQASIAQGLPEDTLRWRHIPPVETRGGTNPWRYSTNPAAALLPARRQTPHTPCALTALTPGPSPNSRRGEIARSGPVPLPAATLHRTLGKGKPTKPVTFLPSAAKNINGSPCGTPMPTLQVERPGTE
jgi:hypothetical protein